MTGKATAARARIISRTAITVLTLSKSIAADSTVVGLEKTATVAGMTADDITALKGVLRQYE